MVCFFQNERSQSMEFDDEVITRDNVLLFSTFTAVAIPAERLTIFGNGFTSEVPGSDVFGFHLVKLIMCLATRANTFLAFVCG